MSGCWKCEAVRPSLRGAEATKQSTLSLRGEMDCFVASAPRNDEARGLSQSAPPQLKRREHGLGDIGGATTAPQFHRLYFLGTKPFAPPLVAASRPPPPFSGLLVLPPRPHPSCGEKTTPPVVPSP